MCELKKTNKQTWKRAEEDLKVFDKMSNIKKM